jgi:hypothetical protein
VVTVKAVAAQAYIFLIEIAIGLYLLQWTTEVVGKFLMQAASSLLR